MIVFFGIKDVSTESIIYPVLVVADSKLLPDGMPLSYAEMVCG